MILDIHADIFSDIFMKRLNNENNIMKRYHLDKYKEGGVNGGIFVFWQDPELIKYYNYEGLKLMMKYAAVAFTLERKCCSK